MKWVLIVTCNYCIAEIELNYGKFRSRLFSSFVYSKRTSFSTSDVLSSLLDKESANFKLLPPQGHLTYTDQNSFGSKEYIYVESR